MKTLTIINKKLLIVSCLLSLTIPHSFSFAMMPQEEKEFVDQQRNFIGRLKSEKNILIDNENWAVSILLQSEGGKPGIGGHAILAFLGKNDEQPFFWAADFNEDFDANNPLSVIGAACCVSYNSRIRTMDYQSDKTELMNLLRGFNLRDYSAWGVSKQTVQKMQQRINIEKQGPPCYNLAGLDMLTFWRQNSTYNCLSWAVEKIREGGIDIPGSLFYRLTHISIPGWECWCGHQ